MESTSSDKVRLRQGRACQPGLVLLKRQGKKEDKKKRKKPKQNKTLNLVSIENFRSEMKRETSEG